jgi:hypothetical protein
MWGALEFRSENSISAINSKLQTNSKPPPLFHLLTIPDPSPPNELVGRGQESKIKKGRRVKGEKGKYGSKSK